MERKKLMDSTLRSQASEGSNRTQPELKVYGYRWVIVIFWSLALCSSTIIMCSFAPFASEIIDAYGITSFHTTYTTIIFQVIFIPINFPANYLFDKYGIMIPTLIASTCYIIGAWVRLLGASNEDRFIWLMVGQTIAAIGQPLQMQAPAKIA